MPVSTFHGLNTSLRGLLAHQRAIDVTGHNVANADTVGYSRQEATLGTSEPLSMGAGATIDGSPSVLGTGVGVEDYRRIRDGFLDLQFRAQNMRLGEQETLARSLDELEFAFQEPGDNGLNTLLSKYWGAWNDLANDPSGAAPRAALIGEGQKLASAFGQLDAQLATVGGQAAGDVTRITATGGQIHGLAIQIKDLNEQIAKNMASGFVPNDLLDRRDKALDELSGLGQVSVTELPSGSINVAFGDAAVALVADTTVTWPQALTSPGGKLGALIDVSKPGGHAATYRAELAGVAKTLADSVNAVHGAPAFFSYASDATAAATLAVAIGAGDLEPGSSGFAGGNDTALAVARLAGQAADDRYTAFVAQVGQQVSDVRRKEANAKALTGSVDERRLETSGVSLDEEMTNLVRFQRGFQASARTMSTFDEMLDQLINRTGRVGL
jgi:flagellar hook-associated protein 1 FlgK